MRNLLENKKLDKIFALIALFLVGLAIALGGFELFSIKVSQSVIIGSLTMLVALGLTYPVIKK